MTYKIEDDEGGKNQQLYKATFTHGQPNGTEGAKIVDAIFFLTPLPSWMTRLANQGTSATLFRKRIEKITKIFVRGRCYQQISIHEEELSEKWIELQVEQTFPEVN